MIAALAFAFGYLLGSIPFGLLLTRAAGGPDIRAIGSGNIGATNVLRTGNKALAAATLLCDMLKGAVAVLAAARYGPDPALAPRSAPFSAICFRSGSNSKAAKGSPLILACLSGSIGRRHCSSASCGSSSLRPPAIPPHCLVAGVIPYHLVFWLASVRHYFVAHRFVVVQPARTSRAF
jgi:hypothetical protein